MDVTLPKEIDIGIIGAGTQALTLMTRIIHKKPKLRSKMLAFDPSGDWLQQWKHQFAIQEIPHLRSPAVHHPHPNPYALRKFAENRPDELFGDYSLPGTQLFEDFCAEIIKNYQLKERIYPAEVSQIMPFSRRFQLILGNGVSISARRVILATGGGKPYFPNWVTQIKTPYPVHTLVHSSQIDLRCLSLAGERILIIGGGLTSGHLALGAIKRGATVDLMTRRGLQEKLFDADPGWLGPKYLKGFKAESNWEKRWQMIKMARNGGSMTPQVMLNLKSFSRKGQLRLIEYCEVSQAVWQENHWQVICQNGEEYHYHRLWLGTGTQLSAENHSLLTQILAYYPTDIVKGLPVLDPYLRIPRSECFVMGGLGALRLGPTARNLSGGIRASELITEALIKPSLGVNSRF